MKATNRSSQVNREAPTRGWTRLVRALCIALLLVAGAPEARSMHDASNDRDGDFVLDAFDNCLRHRNPRQRDTDGDGIGNACDPDFDQNGIVDKRDLKQIRSFIASNDRMPALNGERYLRGRDFDLNGDGIVDRVDVRRVRAFLGKPPGPRRDRDSDGVPDAEDRCGYTPRRFETLLSGCAAIDIAQNPELLIDPIAADLSELTELIRADLALRQVAFSLGEALTALDDGSMTTRGGDPCGGQRALGLADSKFGVALAEFDPVLLIAHRASVATTVTGDIAPEEERVLGLQFTRQRLTDSRVAIAEVEAVLGRICREASPFTDRRERIRAIRDGTRRVELGGRRLYALSESLQTTGAITAGAAAVMSGYDLAGDTGFVTQIMASSGPPPPAMVVECLKLRFVPIQRMAPLFPGPYLQHVPEAYLNAGTYQFEQGMRFGAQSVCTSSKFRYFLELVLDGNTLALELEAGDLPVALPPGVGLNPTLEVKAYVQECPPAGGKPCANPKLVVAKSYPLTVRDRGAYCAATHAVDLFDIDDQDPNDFRTTSIDAFFPAFSFGSVLYFEAEALAPDGSTAPIVVSQGNEFAIHNHDFFPINLSFSSFKNLISFLATGVKQAGGLRWPKLRGINSGLDFQFSCPLANKVVRDLVTFGCNGDWAFFRMPFAAESLDDWSCGQGAQCCMGLTQTQCEDKKSCPNHGKSWAWDFGGSCGDDLRASRGGRVYRAEDFRPCQKEGNDCSDTEDKCGSFCCDPSTCDINDPKRPCLGNLVGIRHQDGTEARYNHMMPDGVLVKVGDIVRRGELIGQVGNTGNASGAHTHWSFNITPTPPNGALPALFEAVDPDNPSMLLECYDPQSGDKLISTNPEFP